MVEELRARARTVRRAMTACIALLLLVVPAASQEIPLKTAPESPSAAAKW